MKALRRNALACLLSLVTAGFASAASVNGVQVNHPETGIPLGLAYQGARTQSIALENWTVSRSIDTRTSQATTADRKKAATDLVSVFRPVAPCRLVDTRGNGAPFTGGPIATGVTRTIATGGACGIPTNHVASISLSFHAFNPNTAQGSVIAMMPVGASNAGAMVGFHAGPMNWFMTSANVKTSTNGSFDIFVGGGATLDIIVDVNGYFQDMNELDVGTQELDINGNGSGTTFEVSQGGVGNAIRAAASTGTAVVASASTTGNAIRIDGGRFAITGSDAANSTIRAAFIHSTSTGAGGTVCSTNTQYSIMKHSSLNNNPEALILITPRYASGNAFHSATVTPTVEYFVGGCNSDSATTGHWYIRANGAVFAANTAFNVFIINQ